MLSLRLSTLFAAILFAAIGFGAPARAQTIVVMVNGEPITNLDIEQRTKLTFLTTHKQASRQEVINELIDEKVKVKEAKRFGVDPTSSDIDQSYAGMAQRMRMTADQLTQVLEKQGIRPDTLRARMKAEMVWTSLVRGRYKESLQVGEKDVAAAVKGSGEGNLEVEASEYKMLPVVLIVPRGSPQSAFDQRKKEAEALRERVTSCAEASNYFKTMQSAAVRDMVTRTSADLAESLRDMLEKTTIGHLTPPEQTKQGVEMVALCARNKTTIDTPKKKEVRDKMFVQKYEAKSKSYLQEVRKAAMIEYR
ncbi:MAG: peptidylprolyl isomerase [Bradyrhizobium sp.]|nr:peptidylprolyl isomerase [Bradyrhizobium sp.]